MLACLRNIRRSELAAWLLLLAAYAHLSLGIISSIHHARMLGGDPGQWAAICTQFGMQRVQLPSGAADDPSDTTQLTQCPACTVASMAAAPALHVSPAVFRQEVAVYRLPPLRNAHLRNPAFTLLPPTRAPPVIS